MTKINERRNDLSHSSPERTLFFQKSAKFCVNSAHSSVFFFFTTLLSVVKSQIKSQLIKIVIVVIMAIFVAKRAKIVIFCEPCQEFLDIIENSQLSQKIRHGLVFRNSDHARYEHRPRMHSTTYVPI